MARTTWLPLSAAKIVPSAPTARPFRVVEKVAAVPTPFHAPAVPLPTSVVTRPAGLTARTTRLPVSETRRVPSGRTARPLMVVEKAALVPAPSQ